MKTLNIKEKLSSIDVCLESISLGDFDRIGEFTAKRERKPSDPNYAKVGCFYRSNYERGILIYHLIRQFKLTSMLEIGFGRGYSTLCAAKAFYDAGLPGRIVSIEPNIDQNFLNAISQVFPREWFNYINLIQGTSSSVLPNIKDKFDLVYIDGDHSYEGTKLDWEFCKNLYEKFLLFDDYHMPSKNDPGIQCSQLIDQIDDDSKELILLDRRIFFDDRGINDEDLNYGQVLLTKPGVSINEW